jgi:hypothetical protein
MENNQTERPEKLIKNPLQDRIKCFTCGNWVKVSVCKTEFFYEGEEKICPACYQKLIERDAIDLETLKTMEKMDAERAK